tara:strand:+ start:506 stop:1498 length:993 start_codon:yes stop_codon:yes gene_type:complete
LIKIKKISYFFFSILFYYLFVTAIVYSFSFISLINGKTYDLFWVKSIQKQIYFKGYRNIWQNNKNCSIFDEHLLYKPKIGSCEFTNPEFKTNLIFGEFFREHNNKLNNNYSKDYIVVLGDSVAMGWGVNNDETFSYHLEKKLNMKVYNMAVPSYGSVREIKKLKLSPFYENSNIIIIQYHPNDLGENKELNINRVYQKEEFQKKFENKSSNINIYKLILGTFKSSIRLFFSDINDKIFREKNLELFDFSIDEKYLQKVLRENIDLNKKRVIIILPINPWQKVINFPENSEQVEYILIKLNKSDFFTIDDHPNVFGHRKIAKKIYDYLSIN